MLLRSLYSPVTDIVSPLWDVVRGDERVDALAHLLHATMRTATAAGFVFLAVPFNKAFGKNDNLSASLAMGSMWIIHPYSAALFHATMSGGYYLVMEAVDMVSKGRLALHRNHASTLALTVGYLYLGQLIKTYMSKTNHDSDYDRCWLDVKFYEWSHQISKWTWKKLHD